MGTQDVEVPRISSQSAHDGGCVFIHTHLPSLPPGKISGTHFCWRLSRPQGHSAARKIRLTKNLSNPIANRTRDLPVCSAVPQPTEPPRTKSKVVLQSKTGSQRKRMQQPKGVKPKMREGKVKSVEYLQGPLKREGVQQTGVKQGLAV